MRWVILSAKSFGVILSNLKMQQILVGARLQKQHLKNLNETLFCDIIQFFITDKDTHSPIVGEVSYILLECGEVVKHGKET